jgi:hypothetical protein
MEMGGTEEEESDGEGGVGGVFRGGRFPDKS